MLDFTDGNIEHVLEESGEVMTTVSGISMYPLLRHRRDMIVVKKVDRKLKKHDVPLYRRPTGQLVLHRILKVTEDGYVIRGDNLCIKEYDVTDNDIIGMMTAFCRNGKFYDCETSRSYKVYIFLNRVSYPIRFLWKKVIRRFLSVIKHDIFKL